MNQRKLIKLGNSSFAIALPKEWVDKSGLSKGDNVFITQNSNGELIVQPTLKKENENKEKIINVQDMDDEEIGWHLISSYVGGSKLIRVIGNKNKLKLVKQNAKGFLNLEPIEEREKEILFKELLDLENVGICNFIKRMDNNLKEMFSILLEVSKGSRNSKKKIKDLWDIDRDVTKFYFLIWRFMNLGIDNPAIQSNLKLSPSSLVIYFWISYNLEQIGDELKRIARICEKIKKRKELNKILTLISESYDKSMKSFFNNDKDLAQSVISMNNQVIRGIEELLVTKGLEIIAEKLHQINANIHRNAKMMFYNL